MRRTISIGFALALVLGLTLVATTPVAAATTWYVDDDNCPGGSGTLGDPYCTIAAAVAAASSGDTIMVAAGTYSEGITLTKGIDLTFIGAGRDVVTWIAPSGGGKCIIGDMTSYTGSMSYEISGFTFDCRSQAADTWGAGIQINHASSGPLTLSIHDNRFIEDRASGDDTHWATSMLLCHNRYAARDGFGNPAVNVYNNIDETWGGMTMSNSQAYDIYNNTFDGCSDAIYNGHGCPDTAGQTFGDHHIYGNTFKNASDSLHPSGLTPAIDWQYYGAGGGTHLPSIIEDNLFEDNDTAIRFGMGTNMVYPAHIIRNNRFNNNGMALSVTGTYASTVNARYNWWGATDGPGPVGPGSGDNISTNVDYSSWTVDTSTYTGTGTAFFTPNAGTITGMTAVSEGSLPAAAQATKPISFPDGLFSFNVTGLTPGATVTVTITLPPGSAPTQYWKYHAAEGGWIQIPMTIVGPPNVITITLVDGGLGDDDLTVNGVIVDQGGPGGGSVGWETYPVSKVRVLLPWMARAVVLVGGTGLYIRRRRTAQS